MQKKALTAKIILFILTIIIFTSSAVFAWVAFVERTQPIILYSGKLSAQATLYQLIDPDFDGEDPSNNYLEINQSYDFYKIIPGQVYAFKLVIVNTGTITSNLSIEMLLGYQSDPTVKDNILITYEDPIIRTQSLDSMMLFNEYELEASGTYTFYFKMIMTEFIGNSHKNDILTIQRFVIVLDQIQE